MLFRTYRSFSQQIAHIVKMHTKSYEEAIRALNALQTNAQTLEKIRREADRNRDRNIPDTIRFAERAGITMDDVDELNIIHVSGTKGKGSTCAFAESILRKFGYKTGLYTSPHLVAARERIRIAGTPLDKDSFAKYFFEVYNKLEATKCEADEGSTFPAYFRFLTIMAFHVFITEGVDVAIVEVGIGGTYDSTNCIRQPVVCGISSLDLDHTDLLGNTLDQIAGHKAGILKHGAPAVTVPQPSPCLEVIANHARKVKSPLVLAPDITMYDWGVRDIELGLCGSMQQLNATLALQLCHTWLDRCRNSNKHSMMNGLCHKQMKNCSADRAESVSDKSGKIIPVGETFQITEQFSEGLRDTVWLGRTQTLSRSNVTYYLDGAHTPNSMELCGQWFNERVEAEAENNSDDVCKVLLFNSTGNRSPSKLLLPLVSCGFDCVVFSPNRIWLALDPTSDQSNFTISKDTAMSRCYQHKNAFLKLLGSKQQTLHSQQILSNPCTSYVDGQIGFTANSSHVIMPTVPSENRLGFTTTAHHLVREHGTNASPFSDGHIGFTTDATRQPIVTSGTNSTIQSDRSLHVPTVIFPCVSHALKWILQDRDDSIPDASTPVPELPSKLKNARHIQLLVTGSLHLVGNVLSIIDPGLSGT